MNAEHLCLISAHYFLIAFEGLRLKTVSLKQGQAIVWLCSQLCLPHLSPLLRNGHLQTERELPYSDCVTDSGASVTDSVWQWPNGHLLTLPFHSFLFPLFLPHSSYRLLGPQSWNIQSWPEYINIQDPRGGSPALLKCSPAWALMPYSNGSNPSGACLLIDQTVPSCHFIHWS